MQIKTWQASGLFCVVMALACGGSGSSGDDSGADTGAGGTDTGATTETGGGGGEGDDTGGVGDTGSAEAGLVVLEDPCLGAGTPYGLLFRSEHEGFVGCGSGYGLWRSGDGGESFEQAHPSADLYVSQLALDAEGRLLVCGRDYETSKALLLREEGAGWEVLVRYGTDTAEPQQAAMSDCGVVAANDRGQVLMASLTVGDLIYSEDDGQSWSAEQRYWSDENLDFEGAGYYYMLNLQAGADGSFYGAGSRIITPPVFFGPSQHAEGTWHHFAAWTVEEDIIGEVWSMGSPDGGASWFVGGRDQGASSRASGFLYRTSDGGASWISMPLPDGTDIVHDIAFDGEHGVAVGHRYPTGDGGFVLLTDDGGLSWREADLGGAVPLLQSAAIVGQTWWIAGDAFLARGTF